jgi:hypothetical protein
MSENDAVAEKDTENETYLSNIIKIACKTLAGTAAGVRHIIFPFQMDGYSSSFFSSCYFHYRLLLYL